MNTETNQNDAPAENGAGEGGDEPQVETITIPKQEWETANQTLGSLKRQVKDLSKPKDESRETPKNQPEDFGLLHKSYLRAAGIVAEDEVELARDIQKKTKMDWDKLVDDDYFKAKLEGLRTQKSNELATSNIKGGTGDSQAKNTPEYWLAKGAPPTAEQVPDRKTRASIARAFMASAGSGKKFYND